MTDTVYVVTILNMERELSPDWVIPWVYGVADAHRGGRRHLEAMDAHAPEDTRRVQALQIGHAAGWFKYQYMIRGRDA